MNLFDILRDNLSVNPDSPEWKSTIMQLKVVLKYEPDTLECTSAFALKFTQSDLLDEKMFSDRAGYVIFTVKGAILLAPSKEELPLVATLTSKDIKSIEATKKLTKAIVTVRTNNHIYDFKVSKKDGDEFEKQLNKARNMR